MKNTKRMIFTVVFVLATAMFVLSTFGATRAALIRSANYQSQFEMYDIGVTLNENGKPLAWRRYSADTQDWEINAEASLFGDIEGFRYGVVYPEVLTVSNSGQIDEYVRVTIYKYWVDEKGNKETDLDLSLIDLEYTDNEDWIIDEKYTTDERTVYYYALPLAGSESENGPETTPELMKTMTVEGRIKEFVTQTVVEEDEETGYTIIETIYDYDGKLFCVDVQVDAIQTHNVEDAAMSAWGRQIKLTDEATGRISLVQEGE